MNTSSISPLLAARARNGAFSRFSSMVARVLAQAAAVALAFAFASAEVRADALDAYTKQTLPAGTPSSLGHITYLNGVYFGTGGAGKIYRSTNGTTWETIQTPTDQTMTEIYYADGVYVATALRTTILTSPDGTTWTKRYEHPDASKWALRFNQAIRVGGSFIAVGSKGAIQQSSDGTTWTPLPDIPGEFGAEGIAFGKGLYVVVGDGVAGKNIRTSPDAITWTQQEPDTTTDLLGVAFGNGVFVATGWDNVVTTSPDGITWTKQVIPFQYLGRIWGVKFLNGLFIAYGQGGKICTSVDGVSWSIRSTGNSSDIFGVLYDGTALLVAQGGLRKSDPWAPVSPGGGGDPAQGSAQLANLSTRAWIGSADAQLISGVVIQGSSPKKVLVRAIGPTLGTFGVTGVLADPQVRIVDSAQAEIGANNDWGTNADQAGIAAATAAVGAFDLAAGSKDAVLLTTLQPGGYSIQVSGADGGTGIALVEVYDVDAPGGCKLVNISSRGYVGTGSEVAIPGFVISGNAPRKLLIRGIGPTLGSFGVTGTIANPTIALFDANQAKVAENDNWQSAADQPGLIAATAAVGAFDLNAGSADAAMLVTVQPGAYTVTVSGVNGATGVALVEIYEVP